MNLYKIFSYFIFSICAAFIFTVCACKENTQHKATPPETLDTAAESMQPDTLDSQVKNEPFTIKNHFFDDLKPCHREGIVITWSSVGGQLGFLMDSTEDMADLFCNGIIHKINTKVIQTFNDEKYILDGNYSGMLEFKVVQGKGYVHVGGEGNVTLPDGNTITISKKSNAIQAKAPTAEEGSVERKANAHVTPQNYDKINNGMTVDQILDILGPNKYADYSFNKNPRGGPLYWYEYADFKKDDQLIMVNFARGKVDHKSWWNVFKVSEHSHPGEYVLTVKSGEKTTVILTGLP